MCVRDRVSEHLPDWQPETAPDAAMTSPLPALTALATTADGSLWLGGPAGLARWHVADGEGTRLEAFPELIGAVHALQRDARGWLRPTYAYWRLWLERPELARLVQVDYTREMAFIATVPDENGNEKTLGLARAISDPDNIGAEFGIILRPGMKGTGLGRILMDKLIRYQRAAGTARLVATVLTENRRMRELARALGFSEHAQPGDAGTLALALDLQRG